MGGSPSCDSVKEFSSGLFGLSVFEGPEGAVRVRVNAGLRWRSQKDTSDVSLAASVMLICEDGSGTLPVVGKAEVDTSVTPLMRSSGCCGTGLTMADVSDNVTADLSSAGWSKLSGRKASPQSLFRTFCRWPKWRFIRSATIAVHDFSTSAARKRFSEPTARQQNPSNQRIFYFQQHQDRKDSNPVPRQNEPVQDPTLLDPAGERKVGWMLPTWSSASTKWSRCPLRQSRSAAVSAPEGSLGA